MASTEELRAQRIASNFNSPVRRSAVWFGIDQDTGAVWRWTSQGSTVIQVIQSRIGLDPDGIWGPETQGRLRDLARRFGEGADAFALSGIVTPQALERALEIAYAIGHNVAPAPGGLRMRVAVPAGATMPRWMVRAPMDGAASGTIELAAISGPSPTASPSPSAPPAPEASPTPPPTDLVRPPTPSSSISLGTSGRIAVGAVLTAAVLAVVAVIYRPQSASTPVARKSNPGYDDGGDEEVFDLRRELEDGVKVQADRGGGYSAWNGGKKVASERTRSMVLFRVGQWMRDKNFYPNIFEVNDHGNVDMINQKGRIIRSWT